MEENQNQFEIKQINFEIVNLIHSMLQGQFAANNILAQVKHPSFNPEILDQLKIQIKDSLSFFKQLEDGKLLINLSTEPLEAEQGLFEILASLQKNYAVAAQEIIRIINSDKLEFEEGSLQLLTAYFAWYTYAQDNYYKQFKKFISDNQKPEYLTFVEQNLNKIKSQLKLTSSFLKSLKDIKQYKKPLINSLLYHSRTLPGFFLSKIHDTNQFIHIREEFNFTTGYFSEEDASAWHAGEFTAIEAGYWRAYSFTPIEAGMWREIGFYSASDAADWKFSNFTQNQAAAWAKYSFSPLLALNWQTAGIKPEHAAILISRGITFPDDLPEDPVTVQELIAKGFSDENEPTPS